VKNLRRLALLAVILGGLIAVFAKIATGNFKSSEFTIIDLSKLPEKIGPFVNQGQSDRDRSLQLRLPQCEDSISMAAYSVMDAPAEAYAEHLYPPDKWRALYVFRGQSYERFARSPAYLRFVLSRSIAALTFARRDLSDEYVFCFHIPVECAINPSAAVATSDLILSLAVSESH